MSKLHMKTEKVKGCFTRAWIDGTAYVPTLAAPFAGCVICDGWGTGEAYIAPEPGKSSKTICRDCCGFRFQGGGE